MEAGQGFFQRAQAVAQAGLHRLPPIEDAPRFPHELSVALHERPQGFRGKTAKSRAD